MIGGHTRWGAVLVMVMASACGSDEKTHFTPLPGDAGGSGGTAGSGGSKGGKGGSSGSSGSSSKGGSSSDGGSAGSLGEAGNAGEGGEGGVAGAAGNGGDGGVSGGGGDGGTAGTAGTAGDGGTAGTAGTAGDGGTAGNGGSAGDGGTAGNAGSAGTAGDGGSAGSAGTAGTAGTAGDGGSAGSAGSAGNGGTGGGGPECSSHEDCDDDNACTDDICNDISACVNTPINCDNGVFCDGAETCDPLAGCQDGSLDLDDEVDCTDDSCDEENQLVLHTPNNGNCTDDVDCTVDTCHPQNDCLFTPDAGNCADAEACTQDVCNPILDCQNYATTAACGDIVISEIMQSPAGLTTAGEWFEITNTGAFDFNLRDCTIEDDGTDSHVVTRDLIVAQGDRITLARGNNPGFVPDYVFANIDLGNDLDELVVSCGGEEMARVNWDNGVLFPDPMPGISMMLDEDAFTFWEAVWGRHWCTAVTAYNQANLGTPGAVNDPCPTYYLFDLTPEQEVPPVVSDARGICTVILNRAGNGIGVNCTHDVVDVNAAHIHPGAPGAEGGPLFTFSSAVSPIVQNFALSPAQRDTLIAGNYYVNVHSDLYSGGEIRGQIVPAQLYTHYLSGAEEVPPVLTSGIGVCAHAIPFGRSFMEAWCTHNLNATSAHIHNAPAGVSGPDIVTFAPVMPLIHQRVVLTPDQLTELDAGNLYINVHTAAHASGEIRGQIP